MFMAAYAEERGIEIKHLPALNRAGMIPCGRSSSDLSVSEMSELMEWIAAWGAENGIKFHDQEELRGRMRREFSKQVKRDAFMRANGNCENPQCGARLTLGKFHYDYSIADGLGGEPTLENCTVLCTPRHKDKTAKRDVPAIARTKRIQ